MVQLSIESATQEQMNGHDVVSYDKFSNFVFFLFMAMCLHNLFFPTVIH
ncbi:hypothetical protein MtrunA17_Chr6g0468351 [Medicago truncatula]|uniref:Transmembrane protein n=1 Tax=Medicago truncatula TaxID=3880 RepID=A0A396HDM1_MEDTR|nr:hypothetical protein MtrunA17_Chr6g0468351 [Medicago truncatula]